MVSKMKTKNQKIKAIRTSFHFHVFISHSLSFLLILPSSLPSSSLLPPIYFPLSLTTPPKKKTWKLKPNTKSYQWSLMKQFEVHDIYWVHTQRSCMPATDMSRIFFLCQSLYQLFVKNTVHHMHYMRLTLALLNTHHYQNTLVDQVGVEVKWDINITMKQGPGEPEGLIC